MSGLIDCPTILVKISVNGYVHKMVRRSYKMRKRAESRELTRARIVDALIELHEEIGPGQATISAVAERAGVQRLTVYRHFPDEGAMFAACTSHWLELNPPPGPAGWRDIEDRLGRVRAALNSLFRYYRKTERMWTASFRDEAMVPALQGPMNAFREYLDAIVADLLKTFDAKNRSSKDLSTTLAHAVQFATWLSLAGKGLSDRQAARLATKWIEAAVR